MSGTERSTLRRGMALGATSCADFSPPPAETTEIPRTTLRTAMAFGATSCADIGSPSPPRSNEGGSLRGALAVGATSCADVHPAASPGRSTTPPGEECDGSATQGMPVCTVCKKGYPEGQAAQHAKDCDGEEVTCPRCGVKVRKVHEAKHLAKCEVFGHVGSFHLKVNNDLVVTEVTPGGAADKAGVRKEDMITKVGEVPVSTRAEFVRVVVHEGEKVDLWVMRGRGDVKCVVTVGAETKAARENRRKKLEERLRAVFPTLKDPAMIDEMLTDPEKCREHIAAAFDMADKDKNGYLDRNEMVEVFRNLSAVSGVPPPTDDDIRSAFDEMDADGNGVISLGEFAPYLRSLFLSVVRNEGVLVRCPICGGKVRKQHLDLHSSACRRDGLPVLGFRVDSTGRVEASSIPEVAKGDVVVDPPVKDLLRVAPEHPFTLRLKSKRVEVTPSRLSAGHLASVVCGLTSRPGGDLKELCKLLADKEYFAEHAAKAFEAADTSLTGMLGCSEMLLALRTIAYAAGLPAASVGRVWSPVGENTTLMFPEVLPLFRALFLDLIASLEPDEIWGVDA